VDGEEGPVPKPTTIPTLLTRQTDRSCAPEAKTQPMRLSRMAAIFGGVIRSLNQYQPIRAVKAGEM
jgi:hypothetical protein